MRHCGKCGSPLEEDMNFCITCGAPQKLDKTQAQGDSQNTQPESPPLGYLCQSSSSTDPYMNDPAPSKNGLGLLLKIGIPVVAIIAIVIVAFSVFRANSLAVTARAMVNFENQIMERFNTTPIAATMMALEKLENGTVTVNFDYSDRWSSIEGSATMISNSRTRDHAFAIEIDDRQNIFTAEAFLNRNRLAVGSTLIDNNFYGITFSTFREDIRTFGREVDMDRGTMDMLANIVELLEMAMNADNIEDTLLEPYVNLITDFIINLSPTNERTRLQAGGESVNARRIEYIITAEDITSLLSGIVDMMRNDDNFRDFYNSLISNEHLTPGIIWMLFRRWEMPNYSDIIRDLRDAVRDLERELSGDVRISIYIGSRDRLIRMEHEVNMRHDGNRIRMNMTYDLGASAQDRWVFTSNINNDGVRESFEIIWDYEVRSNRVINTITIVTENMRQEDEVILISEWSRDSGRFTLSYEDYWSSGELEGIFTYDQNGFRLVIDNPLPRTFDQRLDLEIIGTADNQIRSIDFINIDQWTKEMLEDIDDALWDLGFGGLGFRW